MIIRTAKGKVAELDSDLTNMLGKWKAFEASKAKPGKILGELGRVSYSS